MYTSTNGTIDKCPDYQGVQISECHALFLYLYAGDNGTGHTFWNIVRNRLHKPGKDQIECHHPKPILLDIGDMTVPYQWAAAIVPVQILRIGQLFILGVPGEFRYGERFTVQ